MLKSCYYSTQMYNCSSTSPWPSPVMSHLTHSHKHNYDLIPSASKDLPYHQISCHHCHPFQRHHSPQHPVSHIQCTQQSLLLSSFHCVHPCYTYIFLRPPPPSRLVVATLRWNRIYGSNSDLLDSSIPSFST